MNTPEIYLCRATYDALIDDLCALRPDPLTGQFERHQFVELLGEVGNIWPDTVLNPDHPVTVDDLDNADRAHVMGLKLPTA